MATNSDISSRGMLTVIWLGFAVATILTAFRLYVRRVRLHRLYWDDGFHILAWALLLVSAGLYTDELDILYKVTAVTVGDAPLTAQFLEYQVPKYIQYQFITIFLFWGTVWSVKFGFLLFYRRFFTGLSSHMVAWWIVFTFTLLSGLTVYVPFMVVCGPTYKYFQINACLSQESIERTKVSIQYSTCVDILSDLMIMILPLRILWNLRINGRQKAGLATVFCLATIVIVFAIIRAVETLTTLTPHSIESLERADPIALTVFSVLESSIAVIVSCLPTFRVLFLGTEARPRQHDCEGSLNCMPHVSVSLTKPPKQARHICPHCGTKDRRRWLARLPRLRIDTQRTLTVTGMQSSDRTLVASPNVELKPLSPKAGPLEKPRLIHLDHRPTKYRSIPPTSEVLTIDEETYSDVIRAMN